MEKEHITVLKQETVNALLPSQGYLFVDGTLGGGGHTLSLCSKLEDREYKVIGIDQDPVAIACAKEKLKQYSHHVQLLQGNFSQITSLLSESGIHQVDGGLMLDLGFSAMQMTNPDRGFSFNQASPLDMRMNPEEYLTAEDIVNTWSAKDLANALYQYADERLSRPIAQAIIKARPIADTRELAMIAENIYKWKRVKAKNIHPATRLFMALRIAVNKEFDHLETCLAQLPSLLVPGARIAIISFHSIEDRMVKQYLRQASASCICPPQQPICNCEHEPTFRVIGKPIRPSQEEMEANPQARSATLRVAERL